MPEQAQVVKDAKSRFIQFRNQYRDRLPEHFRHVHLSAKHFEEAQISSRLVPLIKEDWKKSAPEGRRELIVIGCDGEYLHKGDPLWREFLAEAKTDFDASITYVLLCGSNDAKKALLSLKSTTGGENLKVLVPNSDDRIPEHVRSVFERAETHHFVVGRGTKLLWVEGRHEKGATTAENCTYYGPELCEDIPEWKIYSRLYAEKMSPYLVPLETESRALV